MKTTRIPVRAALLAGTLGSWFDALDPDREDSETMRKETIGWIRELLAR